MQWGPDRPAPKVFFVSEMRQWLDARRISLHEGFYSMVQRSTIGLSSRHREILESLYLEFRIPSDQYQRRQQDLTRLVRRWNILTDRGDSPSQVLHYIITKRKNGDWVRLDGEHKRLKTMPEDFLSTEEWEILQTSMTSGFSTRASAQTHWPTMTIWHGRSSASFHDAPDGRCEGRCWLRQSLPSESEVNGPN